METDEKEIRMGWIGSCFDCDWAGHFSLAFDMAGLEAHLHSLRNGHNARPVPIPERVAVICVCPSGHRWKTEVHVGRLCIFLSIAPQCPACQKEASFFLLGQGVNGGNNMFSYIMSAIRDVTLSVEEMR